MAKQVVNAGQADEMVSSDTQYQPATDIQTFLKGRSEVA